MNIMILVNISLTIPIVQPTDTSDASVMQAVPKNAQK